MFIIECMKLKEEQEKFINSLRQNDGVIYKICMMFTDRQPDSVRDLYQDIVCNLWASRAKYREECSTRTWFYRIGLSTAVSRLRKRRHTPLIIELSKEMEESIKEEKQDEWIEELYNLINQLNKADKAIILLYVDNVPLDEIANIMGITYMAVGKRISRIKEKLQIIKKNQDGK